METNTSPTLTYNASFTTQDISIFGVMNITAADITFVAKSDTLNLANSEHPTQDMVIIPVHKVISVGVQPRSMSILDGGWRKRLRIDTQDGRLFLFTINKLNRRIDEIRQFFERSGTLPSDKLQMIFTHSQQAFTQGTAPQPTKTASFLTRKQKNEILEQALPRLPGGSVKKLLLWHVLYVIAVSFMLIPFRSLEITMVVGALIPMGSWFWWCIFANTRFNDAKIGYDAHGVKYPQAEVFDSTSYGANYYNLIAHARSVTFNMTLLSLPLLFFCTLFAGSITGTIRSDRQVTPQSSVQQK